MFSINKFLLINLSRKLFFDIVCVKFDFTHRFPCVKCIFTHSMRKIKNVEYLDF